MAKPWWFHSSPLALDDPLAPLPKSELDKGTWKPFSTRDCMALEDKWKQLPDDLRSKTEHVPDEKGVINELSPEKKPPSEDAEESKTEPEDENNDLKEDTKVIVGIEKLHHVDVISQRS